MYSFKPFVFNEHLPNSIAKPEGRTKANIQCDGKNLYIYSGKDPLAGNYREVSYDQIFVATKPEFREIWIYNLPSQQWKLMGNEKCLPGINDKVFRTIFESNYLTICSLRARFHDLPSRRTCRLHICNLDDESVLVQATSGEIPYSSFANNLIRHEKYLFTVGITKNLVNYSDVYRLNMENGVWSSVYNCREQDPNEPRGRNGPTLVYDGKMIYVFGGSTESPGLDAFIFTKLSAFDLEKNRWITVNTIGDEESMPQFPTAREDFGVTQYVHPNTGEINVIISGGTVDHSDAFDDVWQLNLTSLKWTCLEKFGTVLPHSVEGHSMCVSPAGKLFTFGGFIADEKAHNIPVFNFGTKSWTIMDTYGDDSHSLDVEISPLDRVDFSITQFLDPNTGDVNVVIFGGTNPPWCLVNPAVEAENGYYYRDIWILNLTSMRWKFVGMMPPRLGGKHFATVSPHGQLCIFGGVRKALGDEFVSSSEIYTAWVYIPKLKQICWQALLHYFPNIASCSRKEIKKLGIKWPVFKSLANT